MKEFLLLLRGGTPTAGKTEAQGKAEREAWGAFMGDLTQKGQMVGGLPLISGGVVVSSKSMVREPVKSAAEGIVGGYLVIRAETLEIAAKIAKDCPHINDNGNIEVREMAPMPAM